ncbi:2-hydroxychromene-2-carboxylate isomerase [Solimicrobium silvestre]|uniref:2-hydroxychromene-2-carboxylate isomerase n=1 Tax=Solimicrobium silvestre TaxID=2099400 RepID=A0A2S9H557_9BURK|nr:2-hydroxychromene-2-carboxylate isomerase [Solimicrobium silvestre]PRC95097.1 2-hydroxychromene-2-carboxylate isomerase [Solimicrobium silvestre]
MRAKESRVCEYYFSPVSPWAYFGHQRLLVLAQQHGVKIDMKPIEIGSVFAVSGGVPLAKRAPQRQAYRLQELQRWSDFLAMPIHLQPAFFPVSGDLAAKLLIATQLTHGTEAALNLCTQIMRALWSEQKNIADEATLIELAEQVELDGCALLKSAETASVAAEYQRHTQQAIAANVHGVPWYVFEGQAYWGQDRLEFLERAFAG